MKGENTE